MNSSFKPFRVWEPVPEGSYQVYHTEWSKAGDSMLVASATPQVKIFDREAEQMSVFPRVILIDY